MSFLSVISLLYLGSISRVIEKENIALRQQINFIKSQVNINEIEYSLYNSYDYLKKLQKIYLEDTNSNFINQRISYKYFEKKNLDILHTVGTK